jgi:hypothetical protein
MRGSYFILIAAAMCLIGSPATGAPQGGAHSSAGGEAEAANDLWRARVERARVRYRLFADRAVEDYLLRAATVPAARRTGQIRSAGSIAIMRDPTLRQGDIYVGRSGFLVFHGSPGEVHDPADFTALNDARAKAMSLVLGAQAE